LNTGEEIKKKKKVNNKKYYNDVTLKISIMYLLKCPKKWIKDITCTDIEDLLLVKIIHVANQLIHKLLEK
jgi:hypothetical protein